MSTTAVKQQRKKNNNNKGQGKQPMKSKTGAQQKFAQSKVAPPMTEEQKRIRAKAKMLARAVGSRGVAPIMSTGQGQDSLLTVQQAQISVQRKVTITERAIYMSALGIILRAIQRGVAYPDVDLYQAYLFLADTMLSAIRGEQLKVIELPAFVWEVLAALGPKKVFFKTGEISYSADVAQGPDTTYLTRSINYQGIGSIRWIINLGKIVPGTVNGFPVLEQGAAPLDEKVGATSLGAVWTALGVKRLWTLQAYQPVLGNDASPYAAVVSQFGSTFESVGGVRTAISSEVFPNCPVLAKYSVEETASNVTFQLKRGFWEYKPSAGGPLYVLGRSSEFLAQRQFKNKATPFFKFYNFWDLFERFSCWLGRLQEQAVTSNTNTGTSAYPYPLTSQQAAIALRYTAMKVFSNYLGADLDMSSPDSDLVSITAWAPGQQTPMRANVNMKLPSFLAENIRSIRRFVVPTKFGDVDSIPILGGPGNYYDEQFTWDNQGTPTNLYRDPVGVSIDLTDCTVVENNVTTVLSLDGTEMTSIINMHNNWVERFMDFSSPICDVGDESGTCLLLPTYQTMMSQVVIDIQLQLPATTATVNNVAMGKEGNSSNAKPVVIKRSTSKAALHRGKRVDTTKVGEPTPVGPIAQGWSGNAVTGYTLLINPTAATWKYQNLQWCPIRLANHGAAINEESVSWYRTNMAEPVYIPGSAQAQDTLIVGEDFAYTTVHQRNLAAANLDVKTAMGTTEWINDFKILAARGDGGVIKVLGDLLGNALNILEIKDVAGAVDSFMPF